MDPGGDPPFGRLRVELHAVGGPADPECLVRHVGARAQPDHPRGELERVLVPLEDADPLREGGEDGVAPALVRRRDRAEADLHDGRARDVRARGPGQDLRAETDAHDGDPLLDGGSQQLPLSRQEGVALHLVGMHVSAEHHEPRDVVQTWPPGVEPGVDVGVRDPGLLEDLSGDAELVRLLVADADDRTHPLQPPRPARYELAISFSRVLIPP